MNKNSLHIFCLGLFISLISILYFYSLAFSIPFIVIAILAPVAGFFLFRHILKNTMQDEKREPDRRPLYILAGGIVVITAISSILLRKHGDTDAIGNWNFIARYIADQEHWKNLFNNSVSQAHADYPLAYPGAIAFFWNLLSTRSEIVSLAITYIPAICIPVVIFIELYKKHLPLATAILVIFAFDRYYLNCGLNQYADTLLSFYLLCAIISMQYFDRTRDDMYLVLCTAMLGCCLWTKNEGLIICAVFGLFYFRTFTAKRYLRCSIYGIALPAITFIFFKLVYAPANDLLAGSDTSAISLLTDKARYKLIFQHLKQSFNTHFFVLGLLGLIYIAYSIFRLRLFTKEFLLLCCILAIYIVIYLISPRDLNWHLATSLDRLIVQLSPSLFLILGNEISKINIPLAAGTKS